MKRILKCQLCGKYTLSELCSCGGKAIRPIPPKYSPEDKYGLYRRKTKESDLREKGIL